MNSYCKFENNRFIIGNDQIERAVGFADCRPVSLYILDKKNGHEISGTGDTAMFNVFGFSPVGTPEFSERVTDNDGLSEEHIEATLIYDGRAADGSDMRLTQTFEIYDGSPFISCYMTVSGTGAASGTKAGISSSPDGLENDPTEKKSGKLPPEDTIDYVPISAPHLKAKAITLIDRTDGNDNYVSSREEEIYVGKTTEFSGSMFILSDREAGLMMVKEAPCVGSRLHDSGKDLSVRPRNGGFAALSGSGVDPAEITSELLPLYGSTVGVGKTDELTRLWKRHYSKVFRGIGRLFAMSNTWGDRSRDAALCESFIKKELECAEKLGVDIMQLDDGWQKGISANSAKKTAGSVWSSGFYREDPRFWDVNPEKFPDGLRAIMSGGTELALWFSADGDNDYENHERDARRLAALSEEYGVRQFKLDGMTLKSKKGERNIIAFLEETRRLAPGVTFNLDITAGVRLGYLTHKEIGTLFVENRYTDWTNYYPHAVLKNLWTLSELFPTRKFQFELLNNQRNADKYEASAPGDELAPVNYDIDWLFASVMLSNPLFWMEMQHLTDGQTERLSKIVSVWKKERDALYDADVSPIGEKPDGYAFTGFQAKVSDERGYLVLFRESGDSDSFTFDVDAAGDLRAVLLASNTEIDHGDIADGKITVRFGKKRGYAFIRYEK